MIAHMLLPSIRYAEGKSITRTPAGISEKNHVQLPESRKLNKLRKLKKSTNCANSTIAQTPYLNILFEAATNQLRLILH